MFEKDLPGANSAGFNKASVSQLPLETCETINNSWGYNANDHSFKSVPDLIHYLVRAAGSNANFLLNVGPNDHGKVQPESVERLHAMGEWLQKNGATIYGTRGGPITPRNWGVTTEKGNEIYVHILDWKDDYLALPQVSGIKRARWFRSGEKADITPLNGGMLLKIPESQRDPVDTIVVLERAGS